MSLFTINRYTGSDVKITDEQRKKRAIDTLNEIKLKAKIQKVGDFSQSEKGKSKKKKKSKKQENSTQAFASDASHATADVSSSDASCASIQQKESNSSLDNATAESVAAIQNQKHGESEPDIAKSDTTEHKTLSTELVKPQPYDPLDHFKMGIQKVGNFTVLGEYENSGRVKVSRKLPDWLLHPSVVQDVLQDSKQDLTSLHCIDDVLISNLKELGVSHLFPVQSSIIPAILKDTRFGLGPCTYRPNDLCVSAPTGSGKTLAFALPIVQALLQRVTPAIRALVVLPTRELAAQIFNVFLSLTKNTSIRCALLSGAKGTIAQERKALFKIDWRGNRKPADIVVATPGRLADHLNEAEDLSLELLRFLVIDEADRMMDQIKQQWLSLVEKSVYRNRSRNKHHCLNLRSMEEPSIPLQKLLFSATLSADPEKLEQLNLFQPRLFTAVSKVPESTGHVERSFVGKYTTPTGLEEHMIVCTAGEKPLAVLHLVLQSDKVLCFASSIETARRLAVLIQTYVEHADEPRSLICAEFSSQLTSAKRTKTLKDFKAGKINVLVCSDSMARGMDVRGVSHVVLYDAPSLIKTYIHRIGRTARAGEVGTAYTLLRGEEVFHFKKMLQESGKECAKRMKIPQQDLDSLTPVYEKILPVVAEKLKAK